MVEVVRQKGDTSYGSVVTAVGRGTAVVRREDRRSKLVAAGGLALSTDVLQVLASETSFARLSGALGDVLGRGSAVSLSLGGLCAGDDAVASLRLLCQKLAGALDAPGSHTAALELAVPGSVLSPQSAVRICAEAFGQCTMNIVCDDRAVSTPEFWTSLWELRDVPTLRVAFWPLVSSSCPLLATEFANSVLPGNGLQAPAETAWACAGFSLLDHLDAHGELDECRVIASLASIVAEADALHDAARWPTARMRHDAWMNRRLAIRIEGLGDCAARRGLSPGSHDTLLILRQDLLRIRRLLETLSRDSAQSADMLPAIALHNPARKLPAGAHRDCWEARWRHAIERSEIRHRNLLVMSPWSLFPYGIADLRYVDLLPLLSLADACEFRGRPALSRWNIKEFNNFHLRAWAIMRRKKGRAIVAERL